MSRNAHMNLNEATTSLSECGMQGWVTQASLKCAAKFVGVGALQALSSCTNGIQSYSFGMSQTCLWPGGKGGSWVGSNLSEKPLPPKILPLKNGPQNLSS
eukprot:1142120-Pelagomonas_calceolata.AAC.4